MRRSLKTIFFGFVFLLVILFSLLIMNSFNSQKELSDEEIKERILKAYSSMDSYYITFNSSSYLKSVLSIKQENSSSKEEINETNYFNIYIEGFIDKKNERVAVKMSELQSVEGKSYSGEPFDLVLRAVSYDIYKINDYLYIKNNVRGTWKKVRMGEDTCRAEDLIQSVDPLFSLDIFKVINEANFKRLKDEKIGGSLFYVIEMDQTPVTYSIKSFLDKNTGVNYTYEVKNKSFIIWVNKKTFFIEKLVMNTNILLKEGNNTDSIFKGFRETNFDAKIVLKDVNKNFRIDLSSETLNSAIDKTSQAKKYISLIINASEYKKGTCLSLTSDYFDIL